MRADCQLIIDIAFQFRACQSDGSSHFRMNGFLSPSVWKRDLSRRHVRRYRYISGRKLKKIPVASTAVRRIEKSTNRHAVSGVFKFGRQSYSKRKRREMLFEIRISFFFYHSVTGTENAQGCVRAAARSSLTMPERCFTRSCTRALSGFRRDSGRTAFSPSLLSLKCSLNSAKQVVNRTSRFQSGHVFVSVLHRKCSSVFSMCVYVD